MTASTPPTVTNSAHFQQGLHLQIHKAMYLADYLENPRTEVRAGAVKALARLGRGAAEVHPSVVPRVVSSLQLLSGAHHTAHTDCQALLEMVKLIGVYGELARDALPHLSTLLASQLPHRVPQLARCTAASMLRCGGREGVEALLALLPSLTPTLASLALSLVANHPPVIREVVLPSLKHSLVHHREARNAALGGIASLGKAASSAKSQLLHMLLHEGVTTATSSSAPSKRSLAAALLAIGHTKVLWQVALHAEVDSGVRAAVVSVLGVPPAKTAAPACVVVTVEDAPVLGHTSLYSTTPYLLRGSGIWDPSSTQHSSADVTVSTQCGSVVGEQSSMAALFVDSNVFLSELRQAMSEYRLAESDLSAGTFSSQLGVRKQHMSTPSVDFETTVSNPGPELVKELIDSVQTATVNSHPTPSSPGALTTSQLGGSPSVLPSPSSDTFLDLVISGTSREPSKLLSPPAPESMTLVVHAMTDTQPAIRTAAIAALMSTLAAGFHLDLPTVNALAGVLSDPASAVREAAARCLCAAAERRQAFGPQVISALGSALSDPYHKVRYHVCLTCKIAGKAAAPLAPQLIRCVRAGSVGRVAAASALAALGHAGVTALIELLTDRTLLPRVRAAAAKGLGGVTGTSAEPGARSLVHVIDAPEPAVRAAAVESLGRMASSTSAPPTYASPGTLIPMLRRRLRDPAPMVSVAAGHALVQLGEAGVSVLGRDMCNAGAPLNARMSAVRSISKALPAGLSHLLRAGAGAGGQLRAEVDGALMSMDEPSVSLWAAGMGATQRSDLSRCFSLYLESVSLGHQKARVHVRKLAAALDGPLSAPARVVEL
eukprot:gnl/Dysnectes_brevis/6082_a9164_298.p1 GENE.gnl/Dysnectes_brevis/6082_a9164_298~~gnl/Dysnectes_brevis/6082_a9164_298.p1  ORF type:complete len:914 (-),score=161.56 gnl/Dysnectes_brevis/6082_a9164_298:53-2545(-)